MRDKVIEAIEKYKIITIATEIKWEKRRKYYSLPAII